jgi:hypothetical protein
VEFLVGKGDKLTREYRQPTSSRVFGAILEANQSILLVINE